MKLGASTIRLALVSLSFAPLAQAQQCLLGIKPVTSGKRCECVSTKANCIVTDPRPEYDAVRGKGCSILDVRKDSNGNYPIVEVEYQWEMCNGNRFDINLRFPKAKFYDWTRKKGSKDENVKNPRFPLGGPNKKLLSGQCIEQKTTLTLDTTNRYNVATQLEGFVLTDNGTRLDPKTDYCFNYKSKTVNIKRGLCPMTTAATCTTTGNLSCQEFIDRNPDCVDFTAMFEWEACNGMPRFMKVLSPASNVRIATKVNGKTSNERIARVQDLDAKGTPGACQKFSAPNRQYNTCSDDKLFFSINVQGTKANGKFWHECQSYTFVNLAFKPIPPPTLSPAPSLSQKPSLSQQPSLSPAPSLSQQPSLSQKPSINQGPSKGKGGKGKNNRSRN